MSGRRFWRLSGLLAVLAVFALYVAKPGLSAAPYGGTLAAIRPVTSCETLAQANLKSVVASDVTIAKAGLLATPAGDFCQVLGTIAPAIKFEVDLPAKGWTQRYLQTGCGGLCGTLSVRINHSGNCLPAQQGEMAVASNDMGHQNLSPGDASFGEDAQKRIDFAYRGNHVTALAAKELIRIYYGRGPSYSYFFGCSDGGREALIEAQRYPDDFDGIAAGAPALNFQIQNSFYHGWMARANTGPDGKTILVASRLPILHRAVLTACDELDGLADGLLSDPRLCHFDPSVLQCADGAPTDNCLTPAEVGVVEKFYNGPVDKDGTHFTIGQPQYGSELAWAGVYVSQTAEQQTLSEGTASRSSQYVIFPQVSAADGDIAKFPFTKENFARLYTLHPLYDATNTNLAPFLKHHGRLILWHGWSDPHISPINTIAYYRGLQQQMSVAATNSFVRLFLVPGLYHCNGGDGFSQFDILSPLMEWVEKHKAPAQILASQIADSPARLPKSSGPIPDRNAPEIRTRPIFAYPMQAKYIGTGSVDDPANYVATLQAYREPVRYDWQGSHLIGPDNQKVYRVQDGRLVVTR